MVSPDDAARHRSLRGALAGASLRRPPRRPLADDDDDDLELPVVRSKPLSSADSIAKFHRVRVATDLRPHWPRPSSSSAPSPSPPLPHSPRPRKRPSSTSSSSSSSSKGTPNPFTTASRPTAFQRPKASTPKELQRHARLSSLVLHSVTPREASAHPLAPSSSSSSSSSSSFTEYDVVVENVRASQIWQVSRRFSAFVQFRHELTALFAVPHCHHCTAMHARLDALHDDFPAKRLWGSRKKSVTAQRAAKLESYLHGLLLLASKAHTKQCRLVAASFAMHVRGFLTVESTRFHGIPGGGFGRCIPSLLQELSVPNTGAVLVASTSRRPLATIQEHDAAPWGLALLEKEEDDETEDEDDESPSHAK